MDKFFETLALIKRMSLLKILASSYTDTYLNQDERRKYFWVEVRLDFNTKGERKNWICQILLLWVLPRVSGSNNSISVFSIFFYYSRGRFFGEKNRIFRFFRFSFLPFLRQNTAIFYSSIHASFNFWRRVYLLLAERSEANKCTLWQGIFGSWSNLSQILSMSGLPLFLSTESFCPRFCQLAYLFCECMYYCGLLPQILPISILTNV